MRVIVAGSRDIRKSGLVAGAIGLSPFCDDMDILISGGCKGVDKLAEKWAEENDIEVEVYEADWDTYGRSAGPRRNEEMAQNADALVAIWDGESRGTKNMIQMAMKYKIDIYIHFV